MLRKILFYLTIIYMVSVTGLTVFQYFEQRKLDEESITNKLRFGTDLIKHILPGDFFDRATDSLAVSHEENWNNTITLTNAARKGSYQFLYAMRNYKGQYHFIACSRSPEQESKGEIDPYGLKYEKVPEDVIHTYKTGIPRLSVYRDEFGEFVSYFALEYTPKGTPYIVGADIDLIEYKQFQQQNSLRHFFQLVALLLIFIPIYYLINRIQRVYVKQLHIGLEIMDSTPTCIIIVGEDLRIIFANQSLLRKIGLNKEQVLSMHLRDPLFKHLFLFDRLAYCIENKSTYEGDYPRTDASGKISWEHASVNVTRSSINQQQLYYAFCQDITKHKEIQNVLSKNNSILKYVTHSMQLLLSTPDPYSVLDRLCEDMSKCTDLSRIQIFCSERPGSSDKQQTHSWQLASIWQKENDAQGDAIGNFIIRPEFFDWQKFLGEGNVMRGKASEFPQEFLKLINLSFEKMLTVFPVLYDGELHGFIVTVDGESSIYSDAEIVHNSLLTLSTSIGAALKRYIMESELRLATNAKSSFLSSISHEIRTPLNGILGMINLIKNTELDLQQKEYLSAMKSSGNQLLSLITDVLDLSRIEAGKFSLRKSATNIRGIIQIASSIVAYPISQKNLNFSVNIEDSVPDIVIADELRLKQILVNLLNNAVKFTNQGSITIDVKFRDKDKLQFIVSDTGIGMNQEQLASIFQPFIQAGPYSESIKGTGLGLTISKSLIEMMDGEIMVSSTPGVGTNFIFYIKVTVVE